LGWFLFSFLIFTTRYRHVDRGNLIQQYHS
jgi:hypothetical protein